MSYTKLISALPLGIDPVKIGVHLLNFFLLFGGLTLLLYKPIKKFINNRQEIIKKQFEESEAEKQKAKELIDEYNKKVSDAEAIIKEINAEAEKRILEEREAILADAQNKAEEILKKAQMDIEADKANAIKSLKNEVADVAIHLAANILNREISREENLSLIDESIKEWMENE